MKTESDLFINVFIFPVLCQLTTAIYSVTYSGVYAL